MIIKNYSDLQYVLRWLDMQTEVAYDLETTGLSPRKDMVIGIAIGNQSEGFYIVHQHWDPISEQYFQFLNKATLEPLFAKLKTKKLITFNGSFDVRFTRHYFGTDLAPSLWSEAQLARHTSNENLSPWMGLKDISSELFGTDSTAEQQDLNESIISNGGTPGQVWLGSLDLVGKYAVKDALLTAKVNKHFLTSVEQQGLRDFYFEREVMPTYKHVTIDMEDVGIKLDMPRLLAARDEITADIKKLESQIRTMVAPILTDFEKWYLEKTVEVKRSGGFAQEAAKFYNVQLPITKGGNFSFAAKALEKLEDCLFKRWLNNEERLPQADVLAIQKSIIDADNSFNLSSKDHWKIVFFETLKEQPLSRTDVKKEPQLDDDFLESIKTKYEFVPLLLDFNKLNKIKSTYMDRFIEKSEDGRFYARFGQHTTTTGRFSGDLQQLPRRKDLNELSPLALKYTNMVRDFFIADDSRKLVGADYSSLEVVIFADDAGDESLLEVIRDDLDFYSQVAINAMNLSEFSADKKAPNFLKALRPDLRQAAKVYGLGIRYGMEAFKLSKTLDIGKSEAQKILDNYFTSYPMLRTRMEQLKESAKKQGFVKSKAGRIRHLPDVKMLSETWGNAFENSLKLWEKYNDNPTKYKQMKYLSGKYWADLRNALNFPIQSMAASIVNAASVAIQKELKARNLDATICMNVHDEIVIDCAEQHVAEVSALMQEKMEQTTKLSVPLRAEPQVGKRYSELK